MAKRCNVGSCGQRRKSSTRTAAKSMEKKLIQRAKTLRDDPFIVIPTYSDSYSERCFKRVEKNIKRVERSKDDVKKLNKYAKRNDLSAAVAGTLLLTHSEKAPFLAAVKTPVGETQIAMRGKASREKIVAVQHFDNPVLRLIGVKDVALKKNLHVYSWNDNFVSTGIKAEPPKGFIEFILNKTKLKVKDNVASCGHINSEWVKNRKNTDLFYLRIHWRSADVFFAICENCAKSRGNTIFDITKYLLEKNISDDFEIDVVGSVIKKTDDMNEPVRKEFLDEYLSGRMSDFKLIEETKKDRRETLKKSEEKILVLNNESYGDDVDGFIDALKPNEFERTGLKLLLNMVDEPVVVDDATPNDVLELFWKKHGLEVIRSILGDEEKAEDFYNLEDTPSNILQVVFQFKKKREILSELPSYDSSSPLVQFVDHIAKTYKIFDEQRTITEIKRKQPDTSTGRSVAYAFLLALGKAEDVKWKYKKIEIESGEFLKDYAEKLLNSKPQGYHAALQDLINAAGHTEEIKPK